MNVQDEEERSLTGSDNGGSWIRNKPNMNLLQKSSSVLTRPVSVAGKQKTRRAPGFDLEKVNREIEMLQALKRSNSIGNISKLSMYETPFKKIPRKQVKKVPRETSSRIKKNRKIVETLSKNDRKSNVSKGSVERLKIYTHAAMPKTKIKLSRNKLAISRTVVPKLLIPAEVSKMLIKTDLNLNSCYFK